MITQEQVMEELQYYITEFGMDYYIEIKNGKHFPVTTAYLWQQEKVIELLELYQKRKELQNYRGEHPEEYYEVDAKIEALEEVLKLCPMLLK